MTTFKERKAKGFTKPKVEYDLPGPASQQAKKEAKDAPIVQPQD